MIRAGAAPLFRRSRARARPARSAANSSVWPAIRSIHPKRHGVRGDLAERRVLIAHRAQIGQTIPAVGQHHNEVADDAARIVPAPPLAHLRQAARYRRRQPQPIGRGPGQLGLAVVEYIGWFNHDRLHQALGDIPPAELEQPTLSPNVVPKHAGYAREHPVIPRKPTNPVSAKTSPAQHASPQRAARASPPKLRADSDVILAQLAHRTPHLHLRRHHGLSACDISRVAPTKRSGGRRGEAAECQRRRGFSGRLAAPLSRTIQQGSPGRRTSVPSDPLIWGSPPP
jgi:hypothetical protein